MNPIDAIKAHRKIRRYNIGGDLVEILGRANEISVNDMENLNAILVRSQDKIAISVLDSSEFQHALERFLHDSRHPPLSAATSLKIGVPVRGLTLASFLRVRLCLNVRVHGDHIADGRIVDVFRHQFRAAAGA